MRKFQFQKLYALTSDLDIGGGYVTNVVSVFVANKKDAKFIRKEAIKQGYFQLMGEIKEIDPTDWTITILAPTIPNAHPLPISKGSRFYHEMEQAAEAFKQVLPNHYVIDVVKFDETGAYNALLKGIEVEKELQLAKGVFNA